MMCGIAFSLETDRLGQIRLELEKESRREEVLMAEESEGRDWREVERLWYKVPIG